MNCYNMDFVVLDWNPAQDFYKARGAQDITETESWQLYHLSNDCLKTLEGKK